MGSGISGFSFILTYASLLSMPRLTAGGLGARGGGGVTCVCVVGGRGGDWGSIRG